MAGALTGRSVCPGCGYVLSGSCIGRDGATWHTSCALKDADERRTRYEGIIRELYGSYRSLVAVTGRDDAMQWDGPSVVRQAFGEDF